MAACTKVEIETLIFLLEAKPELWDVCNPNYQDRIKKVSALHSILEDLKVHVPNAKLRSIKDVRNKIQTLRGQFRKELRQIEKSKRSGAGDDEVKKPTLWFYDQMEFLKPFVEIQRERSVLKNSPSRNNVTLNNDPLYLQGDEEGGDDLNESTCSYTSKGARKRKATEALRQSMQDLVQLLSTTSKPRRYEWFGKQVVETLNTFNNEDVADDTIEILQNALREGKKRDKEVSNRPLTSTDLLSQAMHGVEINQCEVPSNYFLN